MKRISLLSAFFFCLMLNAQVDIDWSYTYGGGYVNDHAMTPDGGMVLVGNGTDDTNSYDIKVAKVDASGTLEWSYMYGGSEYEQSRAVETTLDGGYLIVGESNSNDGDVTGNHGNGDIWVIKLDASGVLQWQKSYGGSELEGVYDVVTTTDGNFAIAAWTGSVDGDVIESQGEDDVWVIKIDANGIILWQQTYGGSDIDRGKSIAATPDNGCLVAAETNSNDGDVSENNGPSDTTDVWVFKLDSTGVLQWEQSAGGSADDLANKIILTDDGGFFIGGDSHSNDGDISGNHGSGDMLALKFDASGVLEWQRCLGGSSWDGLKDTVQTTDGGFILSGHSYSNDGDLTEYFGTITGWVVKLEPNGTLLWQKSFGVGLNYSFANSIVEIAPDVFTVGGDKTNGFWGMKFHYETLGMEEVSSAQVQVYPNPTADVLHIKALQDITSIQLYDIDGKQLTTLSAHNDVVQINLETYPAGVYFLSITLTDGGKIGDIKVIKK